MATGHGQAVAIRTAWARPAPISFLLGLLGVLPMLVLTPPFQVSDEQEHFHPAYQLSELQMLCETVLREGCCLHPDRKEFVDFSSMVFSSPLPYLPPSGALFHRPSPTFHRNTLFSCSIAALAKSIAVSLPGGNGDYRSGDSNR